MRQTSLLELNHVHIRLHFSKGFILRHTSEDCSQAQVEHACRQVWPICSSLAWQQVFCDPRSLWVTRYSDEEVGLPGVLHDSHRVITLLPHEPLTALKACGKQYVRDGLVERRRLARHDMVCKVEILQPR
jgi:hypothetical protein